MNKRLISCALALLMVLSLLAVPAFAADGEPEAEALKVEVPVEVTIEGPGDSDTVTIQLTAVTENAPLPEGGSEGVYEQQIKGAGSITLVMTYTKIGVYSYTIKQLPGNDPYAVSYDDAEYQLTVFVTMGEDGTMQTTTVLEDKDGEKTDKAKFHNVYNNPVIYPAMYDPPVKKIVTADRGVAPANSPFIFAMIPGQKNYPMPDNDEAIFDANTGALYMTQYGPGEYEFGWMYFDETDVGRTYTYTVREMPGRNSNYTYDAMIYTMTITVGLSGNQVVLDVSYTDRSGNDVDKAVFTNVYHGGDNPPPPPPPPTPPVTPTPNTGDPTNLAIWISLLVISAAGILVLYLVNRKRQRG